MQFTDLFITFKDDKYINIFAKSFLKNTSQIVSNHRVGLGTRNSLGNIPGVLCRWIHFFFPFIFPQGHKARWVCVSRDGGSCWTSKETLRSFCCLLGGIFWVFFLLFPHFSKAEEGSYLSACRTSGWQHNLSWKSQNSPSTAALAEGFCWELLGFMKNPQDTNHL